MKTQKKIMLAGGGSGGPVAPLLAIANEIRQRDPETQFLFVGTKNGVEKRLVIAEGFSFAAVSAGKLRRYFSLRTLVAPFLVLAGLFQSLLLLNRYKPDIAVGAGGFVQLPVLYAAWILRVPILIHQQDVRPTLSNLLCFPIANKVTTTFVQTIHQFPHGLGFFSGRSTGKVEWTGNPFRAHLLKATREQGMKEFGLKPDWPTLLILGGGTGASGLNQIIVNALPELTQIAQILHITGPGKNLYQPANNYHPMEFTTAMGAAYAVSEVVVCRAGLATITELSNLGKISIIVPLPNSHQEDNAHFLSALNAAAVIAQSELTGPRLVKELRLLFFDTNRQNALSKNMKNLMPPDSAKKISNIILTLVDAIT